MGYSQVDSPAAGKPTGLKKYITVTKVVVLLMVIGILVSSLLVGAIMGTFTTSGAQLMAIKMAEMMTDRAAINVKLHFMTANRTAEAAQFSVITFPTAAVPFDEQSDGNIVTAAASSKVIAATTNATTTSTITTTTTLAPTPTTSSASTIRGDEGNRKWFKWQTLALSYAKQTFGELKSFSLGFLDGSYSGYSINRAGDAFLYSVVVNQKVPAFYPTGNTTAPPTRAALSNRTLLALGNGSQLNTYVQPTVYDPRFRPWFNYSMAPFEIKWGDVMPSAEIPAPVINVAFSLFNRSNLLIGIGSIDLQLNSLSDIISKDLPTENTHVFVLDSSHRIVASSYTASGEVFKVVSANYTLTADEVRQKCSFNAGPNYYSVMCLKSAEQSGYKPLIDLKARGLLTKDPNREHIHKVDLDGEPYWSSVTFLSDTFKGLDWKIVVLVPQDDVLKHVADGIRVSVIVGSCLVVIVALSVGLLTRVILRPLIDVVWRLESAAYLTEESKESTTTNTSDTEFDTIITGQDDTTVDAKLAANKNKKEKKMKKKSDRTSSYLSDVAAIQRAYWTMADELAVLKGYIPEHIRQQLLTHRNGVATQGSSQPQNMVSTSLSQLNRSEMSSSNPTTAVAAITAASPPNAYLNANSQSGSDPNGQSRSLKLSKKARSAIIRKSQKQQADPSDQPDEPPASGSPLLAKVPSNVFSDLSPNDSDDNVSEDSVDAPHASVPMGDSQGPEGGNPKAQSQNNNINNELTNTLSHQNETSRYDSLAQFSFGSDTVKIRESEPLPPFTGENTLVDRHISVAVVNLVGFHQYVAATPSNRVAKDHECMVSYIHEAAKKCGGVLDTFSGDKFWVSFNATTDCDESPIAAALFACEVASTINREASVYHRQLEQTLLATQITGRPPLAKPSIKFGAALRGATIGVSTGRGKVGTLGNSKVRRHAILSSVVSEAAALERMAGRYPDCGVMVGGDMIPAIEGYFQYLLLDATALPGSGGLRRRIGSIKGLVNSRTHPPSEWMNRELASQLATTYLPENNPYDEINNCFNAFLEGRISDIAPQLTELAARVTASQHAHENHSGSSSAQSGGSPRRRSLALPANMYSPTVCADIAIMLHFVASAGSYVDGRQYKSPLSCMFEQLVN